MTLDLPLGYRLVLAGGRLGWFWSLAGVAAVVLLLILYREERHLVSKRIGLILLSLRLLAAAILVSSLFEPIAARTVRETLRGRVILGVDLSESMATTDSARNASERSKLLKLLHLPAEAPLDAMSRREIARGLMADEGSPLRKMAAEHDLSAFAFARETSSGTLDAIAETLKSAGSKPGDPAFRSTEWLGTLSEGLKTSDSPILGVVLVTDGRRNGPADPSGVIGKLGSRGVPVYSVLVGSTQAPKDAAVTALKGPETVYQGDVATVEATLKLDGYEGTEVAVSLQRPGAKPLVQKVRAEAKTRPVLTFRVPLETVGGVPITVSLGPLEGDTRPENDRRTVTVQVADDQAKVLLVDGEARWEFQYLRNAFARDPRIAMRAVVFQQPNLGPAPNASDKPTYLVKLPEVDPSKPTDDPLSSFDAILLGDVDPADLPLEVWNRLDRFVSERGGTLILNPGPKHWSSLTSNDLARKLIPLLDPAPWPVDPAMVDPSHPALPPGRSFDPDPVSSSNSGAWPMLQLAAEADESRKRWKDLPKLPWSIGGRAKPGASTLAISEGDPSAVVLATQAYGLGKVLWVGTDATWRWRFRIGDAYHHRFWGQVIRWSASGKLGAGNALVRFGPLKPQAQEETAVRIQAKIAEGVVGLSPDTLLAARIYKEGTKDAVAVVPLRSLPGRSKTFEGMAPGLAVGSYKIRLDAPGLALNLDVENIPEAPLEVSPREGSEMIELAADRDTLDRLAKTTGGKVFLDADADELPPFLKAQTRVAAKTYETPLWDAPGALLLFVGIVTTEWIVRKRVGLP